jgi:hypothetical protein
MAAAWAAVQGDEHVVTQGDAFGADHLADLGAVMGLFESRDVSEIRVRRSVSKHLATFAVNFQTASVTRATGEISHVPTHSS